MLVSLLVVQFSGVPILKLSCSQHLPGDCMVWYKSSGWTTQLYFYV